MDENTQKCAASEKDAPNSSCSKNMLYGNIRKNAFNICVIGLSVIVLVTLVIKMQGIGGFLQRLGTLEPSWIVAAMGCMVIYWFLDAYTLHIITLTVYSRQKLRDSLRITMIGQFFNSVTPFASGGQPAQLYVMIKEKVEGGLAGTILMIKFITFHLVLTFYTLAIVVFRNAFFAPGSNPLFLVVILGFAARAAAILVSLLFSYNRTVTRRILMGIFTLLKKVRLVKDPAGLEMRLENEMLKFHENALILRNNLGLMFKTLIITALEVAFFFAIPYCIYRSFGFYQASFTNMIAAQVCVTTAVTIIPLPGAAGGAEGGFYLFFKTFFGSNTIMSAILLWRLITYYSCIGFGGIFTMINPQKKLKKA